MTSRKFIRFTYRILWIFLLMLPFIAFVLFNTGALNSDSNSSFEIIPISHIISLYFDIQPISFISDALNTLASYQGFDFLASGTFFNVYGSYMIAVTLLRLIVDVLLFIPRLALKWMGKPVEEC